MNSYKPGGSERDYPGLFADGPGKWSFKTDRPIYLQLVEQLKLRILTGVYKPGERLPSVRELAGEFTVTPNTLQRAMSELEGLGLVTTQRTVGRSITDNTEHIGKLRTDVAQSCIGELLSRLYALGYTDSQIIAMMNERIDNNG